MQMLKRIILTCLACQAVIGLPAFALGDESTVKPTRDILVDSDVWTHFNWASFDQDKIVSYGDYQ